MTDDQSVAFAFLLDAARAAILLAADGITARQGTLPTADEAAEVIAVAWAADAREQGLSERVVVALAGAVVAAAEQLNEELLVELP